VSRRPGLYFAYVSLDFYIVYSQRGGGFGLTPLYDVLTVENQLPEGFAESVWTPTSKRMLKQAKSFLSDAKA
jgi:hypothetical protein